ncbi:hypothetical protein OPV22_001789 [Ensete ventricosum]|uniref:Uncharacterized protein n=1 Tax=Ensete ventricosum TaxID=4639 RepID=A0AAV8QEQ1_ENSVE|nr:hypothetical protein OPV22_001789 [Ensete ventricosum]
MIRKVGKWVTKKVKKQRNHRAGKASPFSTKNHTPPRRTKYITEPEEAIRLFEISSVPLFRISSHHRLGFPFRSRGGSLSRIGDGADVFLGDQSLCKEGTTIGEDSPHFVNKRLNAPDLLCAINKWDFSVDVFSQ